MDSRPLLGVSSPPSDARWSRREAWTQQLTRWLQLLFLTSPFAFWLGYSYHGSYVHHLGLLPTDYPLTWPEYLMKGVYAIASVIVHTLTYLKAHPELLRGATLLIAGLLVLIVLTLRGKQIARGRFRSQLDSARKAMVRVSKAVRENFKAETIAGLAALFVSFVPYAVISLFLLIALATKLAASAARADARAFWHSLETSRALSEYPMFEGSGAGNSNEFHIVAASPTSYMLFDGQRFRTLRRDLVPQMVGAASPWMTPTSAATTTTRDPLGSSGLAAQNDLNRNSTIAE